MSEENKQITIEKIPKESLFDVISEKMGIFGNAIGNQKHLSSIRDAFATFMPLIIVGSLAIMINSVFVSQYSLLAYLCGAEEGTALFESWSNVAFYLSPIFVGIADATMSFFSVYMAFLFGYFLAGTYGEKQVFGGLLGLATFLSLQPIAASGGNGYLGTTGLLLAMFAGLTSPMLFHYLNQWDKLKVKMPDGVPPAVASSFSNLFPIIITIFTFALIQPIWGAIMYAVGPGSTMVAGVNTLSFDVLFSFDFVDSNGAILEHHDDVVMTLSLTDGELFWMASHGNVNLTDSLADGSTVAIGIQNYIESTNNQWQNVIVSGVGAVGSNSFGSTIDSGWIALSASQETINAEYYYIFNAVYTILFLPLQNMANTIWAVLLVMFLISLFWFFGIHGTNIMAPFINTFWTTALISNVALYGEFGNEVFTNPALTEQLYIWTEATMNAFVMLGGVSATLALITAVSIFTKDKASKTVAGVAAPAGIFEINEPVIFGLPIMLNPSYMIPFFIISPTIALVAYIFTSAGWVNPTVVMVPWTTPPFLYGLLTTLDWRSLIVTSITFGISFLIYLPFVLIDSKRQIQNLSEEAGLSEEEFLKQQVIETREEKKQSKIDKVQKPVVIIEKRIRELNNSKDKYNINIETIKNNKENSINLINSKIEVHNRNIKKFEGLDTEEVNKFVEKTKSNISSLNKKIEKIEEKSKNDISSFESKLNKVKEEIETLTNNDLPKAKESANENQKLLEEIFEKEDAILKEKLELKEKAKLEKEKSKEISKAQKISKSTNESKDDNDSDKDE